MRLLLDTNAMVWFLSEAPMEAESLFGIAEAQAANELFLSPITAWEAALAIQKKDPAKRPDLRGQPASTWFSEGRRQLGARLLRIGLKVSAEAARVPDTYSNKDPGDCFIIATARVHKLTIVTRDGAMSDLAEASPEYIKVLRC